MVVINANELIFYESENGEVSLEIPVNEETVWLSQSDMVTLFKRDVSVISRHINNVLKEENVDKKSNLQKMQNAHSDKPITRYSLDIVISVGYRIKSQRGIQFRQWATND